MNRRIPVKWLLFLSVFCCLGLNANAQAFGETDSQGGYGGSESLDVASGSNSAGSQLEVSDQSYTGEWFWALDFDDVSSSVITVVPDAGDRKVVYAGGIGFIQTSRDGGESWTGSLTLTDDGFVASSEEETELANVDQLVERKKDMIREELETIYGSSLADRLIDDMDDDDIAAAHTTSDLSELSDFEISIDFTELMESDEFKSYSETEQDALARKEDALANQDFIHSFRVLTDLGAEEDAAIAQISQQNAVWQFVSTNKKTYAVTTNVILVTGDRGKTWDVAYKAETDQALFSASITANAILFGSNQGLVVSVDKGKSWKLIETEGAVYKIVPVGDNKFIVGTTRKLYVFEAETEGLYQLGIRVLPGELILDFAASSLDDVLAITENNLYAFDGKQTRSVTGLPFKTQPFRQIELKDSDSGKRPIVRTELAVYEMTDNGWKCQEEGIFGELTRHLTLTDAKDRTNAAYMVTSNGILVAARSRQRMNNVDKLDYLQRLWEQEPSEQDLIQAALRVQKLDVGSQNRWKTRIWTSMLLPIVKFDYQHIDKASDKANRQVTLTGSSRVFSKDVPTWKQQRTYRDDWQIVAHWDMNIDILMNDEYNVTKLYGSEARNRSKLIDEIKKTYNRRHQLQISMIKSGKLKVNREVKMLLELQKQETQLFYLTNGYFKPNNKY